MSTNAQLILCDQKLIINLTEIISNCKLDFNGTNLDIWPARYLNAQKGKCKFIITSDQTYHTPVNVNGQIVYSFPTDIISGMCLNNCSNKGFCSSSGSCACNTGYDGIDCSINLTKPPNITTNTFQNNMCDTRKQNCYELFFKGSGFSDSSSGNALVSTTIYDPIKVN